MLVNFSSNLGRYSGKETFSFLTSFIIVNIVVTFFTIIQLKIFPFIVIIIIFKYLHVFSWHSLKFFVSNYFVFHFCFTAFWFHYFYKITTFILIYKCGKNFQLLLDFLNYQSPSFRLLVKLRSYTLYIHCIHSEYIVVMLGFSKIHTR